jgi:hypothetical protein
MAVPALVALSIIASGASAASKPTKAACQLSFAVALSPGISMTPTKGTFTSSGGRFSCLGTVFGQTANGQSGSLLASGSYGAVAPGDTCAKGAGSGTFKASVVTTTGTITASGSFTFTRVGGLGQFTGTTTDGKGDTASVRGGFGFDPTTGNCATSPVTKANVTGGAALNG